MIPLYSCQARAVCEMWSWMWPKEWKTSVIFLSSRLFVNALRVSENFRTYRPESCSSIFHLFLCSVSAHWVRLFVRRVAYYVHFMFRGCCFDVAWLEGRGDECSVAGQGSRVKNLSLRFVQCEFRVNSEESTGITSTGISVSDWRSNVIVSPVYTCPSLYILV